eukprot:GFUD01140464.1.p1 GENE.GFUD01140464.1~~GFUD01140464.1.p1  ORF type:complete len:264 (-),score=80.19 GFUD01140464.1:18-809(-)
MSAPLIPSESSLILPASSSSTYQDETSFTLELPDPNRFTASPQYIEPSLTYIGFRPDILDSDQAYWTGDGEGVHISDPDGILDGDNYLLMFENDDKDYNMQFEDENVSKISERESKNLRSERKAPVNPSGQFLTDPKSKLPNQSKAMDNNGDVVKKQKMDPEEAKRRKQARDCLRQKNLRENVIQKNDQEKVNIERLKNMIEKKIEKITAIKKETQDLKLKLLSVETEIQAVQKLSKEKVKSEAVVKEKFKIAHKHHLVCKRK